MTTFETPAHDTPARMAFRPVAGAVGWWQSLERFQRVLLLLMIGRWLVAALFILNILPLERRDATYIFFLHHGGDNDDFWALAQSILAGQPKTALVGPGAAFTMSPWIVLLQPPVRNWAFARITAPLVLVNGFLFGGLSVLATGIIARASTGSRAVGLIAAALWMLFPLLVYIGFFWHPDPVTLASVTVPKVAWLNGLSDGPAAFFILLATMLLAVCLGKGPQAPPVLIALAGAATGLAVSFRVHVAPSVALLIGYTLVAHGPQAVVALCLGGLLGYLPNAVYNQVVFGIPVTTGYISYFTSMVSYVPLPNLPLWARFPFDPGSLAELTQYHLGRRPWIMLPLAALGAAGLWTVISLWKTRGWQAVALLIGVPLAYMVPMALAWPFRADVIRFSIPAFPFGLIVLVYVLSLIWEGAVRLRQPAPTQG